MVRKDVTMISKIRAWDKEKNCWTNYAISDDLPIFYDKHIGSWHRKNKDRFVLMQSTGLKDKNGVEIYEGDIVKVETRGGVVYGDVKYKSCSFMICSEDMDRIMLDCWDYEVIGNIYENPELMEV